MGERNLRAVDRVKVEKDGDEDGERSADEESGESESIKEPHDVSLARKRKRGEREPRVKTDRYLRDRKPSSSNLARNPCVGVMTRRGHFKRVSRCIRLLLTKGL